MTGLKLFQGVATKIDKIDEVRKSVMTNMRKLARLYIQFRNVKGQDAALSDMLCRENVIIIIIIIIIMTVHTTNVQQFQAAVRHVTTEVEATLPLVLYMSRDQLNISFSEPAIDQCD